MEVCVARCEDLIETVEIPKREYEELLRDSERLCIVADYVTECMNTEYQLIGKEVLCLMLKIRKEEV